MKRAERQSILMSFSHYRQPRDTNEECCLENEHFAGGNRSSVKMSCRNSQLRNVKSRPGRASSGGHSGPRVLGFPRVA